MSTETINFLPGSTMFSMHILPLYCPLCAVKFIDIFDIPSHLKGHISSGVEVTCPFAHYKRQFSVKSSFSSHISRHHSKRQVEFLSESVLRENYKALQPCCGWSRISKRRNFAVHWWWKGRWYWRGCICNWCIQRKFSTILFKSWKPNLSYNLPSSTI